MTTVAHSPSPWTALPWTAQGLVVVALDADKLVCITSTTDKEIDEARANAAFIVRAVNAHATLLGNVRQVLKGFSDGVFVRNTSGDADPGWAIRILPYVTALARLEATGRELDA